MLNAKHILLIFPERLGDSLFYTPVLRLLKKHLPHVDIDVITLSDLSASVLAFNPYVKHVYSRPNANFLQGLKGRYDVALNIHDSADVQAILTTLAVPVIIAPQRVTSRHQSLQALEFVQGLLRCHLTEEDYSYDLFPQLQDTQKMQQLLIEQGVDIHQDILVGCHIGCHGIAKRGWRFWKRLQHPKVWPLENFIQLGHRLRGFNPRIRMLVTGSQNEAVLAQRFIQAVPATINLIAKTSVLELAALMEYLSVFVTSDTGALHVACASPVNVVALFGPTSLAMTGPYPSHPKRQVLQAPTMTQISVEAVIAKIRYCGVL